MAATTSARDALLGDGNVYSYGVASGVKVYAGTIGSMVGGNYLGSYTSGATVIVGIIAENVDNSSTNTALSSVTQGGLSAKVYKAGIFRVKAAGTPAQTDIGQYALPTDNQTAGITNVIGVSGVGGGLGSPLMLGRVVGFGTSPYSYYDVNITGYVS